MTSGVIVGDRAVSGMALGIKAAAGIVIKMLDEVTQRVTIILGRLRMQQRDLGVFNDGLRRTLRFGRSHLKHGNGKPSLGQPGRQRRSARPRPDDDEIQRSGVRLFPIFGDGVKFHSNQWAGCKFVMMESATGPGTELPNFQNVLMSAAKADFSSSVN